MGAETTQWISKMNYYLREVFALAKAVVVAACRLTLPISAVK